MSPLSLSLYGRFRASLQLLAAAVVLVDGPVAGVRLGADTNAGWQSYVSATTARRARELGDHAGFLALDFQPGAVDDRRAILAGGTVVRRMVTPDGTGRPLSVPSARVHHWRGAVFLPGTTVPALLSRLQFAVPPAIQQDVLQSSVLWRRPEVMHVYLRLEQRKLVTVVYNTEHDVTFMRYGSTRGASASTATKIAEVSRPGTTSERELAPGEDRGFLWRLNAYWRYEAVPGGVIAECESLSLSRDVPFFLEYLVGPLVESTARESMERTLDALRMRYGQ